MGIEGIDVNMDTGETIFTSSGGSGGSSWNPDSLDVTAFDLMADGLTDLEITPGKPTDIGSLVTNPVMQEPSMGDALGVAAAASQQLEQIQLAGVWDSNALGSSVYSEEWQDMFVDLLSTGANQMDETAAMAFKDSLMAMPVGKSQEMIAKSILYFGNKPKNTWDPRTWSGGTWLTAAGLLISWMQAEENRKENTRRYDQQQSNLDREYALRSEMAHAQLALNEAALAKKPSPGSGATIGKTSIFQ